MTAREWKPGDVGVTGAKFPGEKPTRFMVCGRDGGLRFDYVDGDTAHLFPRDDARPLVVIDPEDREAVERLADLNERATPDGLVTPTASTNAMQAALREFANPTPPKPAEPTGLGAVVEDAEGERWVRKGTTDHGEDWARQIGNAWTGGPWDRISAVRVLSEGVL